MAAFDGVITVETSAVFLAILKYAFRLKQIKCITYWRAWCTCPLHQLFLHSHQSLQIHTNIKIREKTIRIKMTLESFEEQKHKKHRNEANV